MPLKPCLDCGTPSKHTRCPTCTRSSPRGQRSSRAWTNTSRTLITNHRAVHGDWCPGTTTHPAHASTDLTVDHTDPLATTGRDTGRYRILCRSENSRLGALQG